MSQKDGGEELDDLFLLLDHGYLEDDVDFNVEIDAVVTEVSVVGVSNESFKCEQCEIVCKSKRGLTRHMLLLWITLLVLLVLIGCQKKM